MRIKEVEKETGLTAKAIRLYESKGLLTVERNTGNDYRDYSQEDVKRLKTIAVLRKLEIPIAEIREWADGKSSLSELLHRAAYEARQEENIAQGRKLMVEELLKVLETEPEKSLPDAIAQAEDLRERYRALDEAWETLHGVAALPLRSTLFVLSMIGAFLVFLYAGQMVAVVLTFFASLVAVPIMLHRWRRYFAVKREKRTRANVWKVLWLLIAVPVVLGLCLGSVYLVLWCQREWYGLTGVWHHARNGWMYAVFFLPCGVFGVLSCVEWKDWKLRDYGIGAAVLLLLCSVVFYGGLTACTTFDGTQFVRYGFFRPWGKVCGLDQVERVEAGFYGDTFLIFTSKGEFYYKITFADGPTEDWGEKVMEGGLTDVDWHLMAAGVEKKTDTTHRADSQLDETELAICDEILERKPNENQHS